MCANAALNGGSAWHLTCWRGVQAERTGLAAKRAAARSGAARLSAPSVGLFTTRAESSDDLWSARRWQFSRYTVLQSRPLPLRARMEADTDSSRDVFEVRGGLLAAAGAALTRASAGPARRWRLRAPRRAALCAPILLRLLRVCEAAVGGHHRGGPVHARVHRPLTRVLPSCAAGGPPARRRHLHVRAAQERGQARQVARHGRGRRGCCATRRAGAGSEAAAAAAAGAACAGRAAEVRPACATLRAPPRAAGTTRWRGRCTRCAVRGAHLALWAACDAARGATQVLDIPIDIVATTDTAVAVCKPASMPVHPTVRGKRSKCCGAVLTCSALRRRRGNTARTV